jgi:hypothetical protein
MDVLAGEKPELVRPGPIGHFGAVIGAVIYVIMAKWLGVPARGRGRGATRGDRPPASPPEGPREPASLPEPPKGPPHLEPPSQRPLDPPPLRG